MIDIDKYEGHTRGPWRYYDDEENDCWVFEGEDIEAQARVAFFAFTPCEGIAYLDDPDLDLMIDAPLLLAEVNRLSALADALWDLIPSYLSTEATDVWNEHMGDEEVMA